MFAACAATTACVARMADRLRVPSIWAVIAVCIGVRRSHRRIAFVRRSAASLGLLSLSPTYIRAGMVAGWEWTASHVGDSVLANTGNNVPYPLFGEHLSNSVRYVNIDRHANWRFHDYARARGEGGLLGAHSFAQPSGQLMPLVRDSPEAARPRFERWEGDRDAWLANLRAAGVSHLFVTALSAYELEFSWHDDGGLPNRRRMGPGRSECVSIAL